MQLKINLYFANKGVVLVFKKMVIASEISKGEFDIIKCLKGFKKLGAEECLLLQCLNSYEVKSTISSFVTDILEENLNRQKKILLEQGYSVETRVVSGDMKHEINRIAKEENYSIIVAGVADHTLMGELFFGGAAHEVIHHASKPVLLIRVSDNPDEAISMSKECDITDHILFPTDFSDNANIAFEYVKKMVSGGVKKITLVHVQEQEWFEPYLQQPLKEFLEDAAKRLQEMKDELLNIKDVEVSAQVIYGSPSAELLKLIDELKISLVVLGSQGRGFIKEIYLGSVSHNIARHSAASVLLIPANRG